MVVAPIIASYNSTRDKPFLFQKLSLSLLLGILGVLDSWMQVVGFLSIQPMIILFFGSHLFFLH
jgi:hypothetical protein